MGSSKAQPSGRGSPDTQQLRLPLLQGALQLLVVRLKLVSLHFQAVQTSQLAAQADDGLCLGELGPLTVPESTRSASVSKGFTV